MSDACNNNGWFWNCKDTNTGWQLDAVGLLAVIGEGIVTDQAQTITNSWLCLLPRLIPAPTGLLRPERPRRLNPVHNVTVKSVLGGAVVHELNYFANMIHRVEDLDAYEFREVRITRKTPEVVQMQNVTMQPQIVNDQSQTTETHGLSKKEEIPLKYIKAKLWSPSNMLTVVSSIITIGLLVAACVTHDGAAALAISVLAIESMLGCAARLWQPGLTQRPKTKTEVPEGDIVIRTREGAFVVVHCKEDIARELYIGNDLCKYYFTPRPAKILSGLATAFLMVGVILLGNAGWNMQAGIGGAFIAFNAAYWAIALYPAGEGCWKLEDEYDVQREPLMSRPKESYNFTTVLWYAIQKTGEIDWVKSSDAAPNTHAWHDWLDEAYANKGDPKWPAVERLGYHLRRYIPSTPSTLGHIV